MHSERERERTEKERKKEEKDERERETGPKEKDSIDITEIIYVVIDPILICCSLLCSSFGVSSFCKEPSYKTQEKYHPWPPPPTKCLQHL